jgi:hypothetical protein
MGDLLWSMVLLSHYRRKKSCQISELWLTALPYWVEALAKSSTSSIPLVKRNIRFVAIKETIRFEGKQTM